ncbi:MAG: LEPR-XLL domain-containing protein, partial [Sedimentisphaerales bacterium]|nr:LEPR-XLL domain-containing protein [Sedimentisphaerales bacterium]
MVQAPGPPLLEQLEPRLLLSADLIGTDLLNPLQSSPGEQAIVVDLNQGQEVVQENDCSLVLTYLVSTGEPDSPQADMSDGPSLADTEDAGPGRQPLDDAVRAAKVDDVAALTFVATPLGQVESAVQIATESYGLTAPIEDEPAGLIVSDQQDGMTGSDGFPIEARGPPNGDCDSVSPLCQATYGEEEQPITLAEGGASSTTTSLVAPDLPGLVLLDPDISNWQGQIVYLDFDGEQDAVYNGPVTIGPFDVPAFQPVGELAGQEQVIIDQVLLNLQDIFAGSGVIFATQQPSEGSEYSTIYIGGDDSAFDQYGSFLGLAEQVDVRNTDLADEAFVFGERLGRELPDLASLADKLTCIIAHEAGHLLGYVHQDAAPATSALSHLASSAESYHQVATLTPSGSTIGSNVSIDGDYAVVGDRWDNDKGVRAGAAYVFRRNGTRWVEEAKLYASDCAELDQFGWSVDISGDHIIVGAPGASGSSLGAAYIFKRDNTGWVQEAKLAASDGAGGDEFGASVAIDGAYAVVGAPGVENGYSSGAAYVFGRDGSDWTQQTTLLPSDVEYYNEFGHSVSVSGDYALIGADRLGPCIFRRNGTVWTEEAKLDIPSHQTTIIWPDAVSIDGEYALVGVAQDSDKGGCAGAAYVFKRDGIDWTQQEKLLAPYGAQGDFFGYSVCIDGDYAVVGAIQDDDNGQNSGSAYLFRRSGTYWTEYAKLEPSDADGLSFFGGPVSVSGEFVLVGEAHDSYLFFVPKQERYVVDVYPGRISRSDRAIVHILGGGFDTGMEVTVQDAGGQRTSAETVVLSSANVIIAHFDLSAASLGLYDVCVAWADGHEETTEEALDVRELADGALYSYPDQDLYKDETREYPIEVPDTQNLFVTLQKTTLISYGDSWASELSLLRGRKEIAATSGSHDLMLHVVDPEPGSYTVEVTAQRGGEGHITVWTALPELPLGEWVVGTVFASYGSVWYQVEVPPGQETLYLQAEAMGMWSHFDIYRGQYGSSQHWVSAQGTGTSIEIPNPAPGTYIVEFLDSAMIWVGDQWAEDQSRDVMLKADIEATGEPPPGYLPTIYSVSPEKGGNTGFVTVEIKGGWLDENATVSLVRSGYEDIVAQSVWADDRGLGLTATFDLTDQQPGEWKLILTNPDGQTTTSAKPFVVETGCAEELSLEIVGRTVVRSGRATNYDCLVANHANTNATDVYVLLTVTENESAREQNSPSSYTASFESRLPESAVQAGDDGGGGLLGWLIRKIPPETRKSFRFGYRTAQEGSLTMTLKGGKGIMDACFAEVGMLLSGEDPDAAKAEAQRVYEEHYESVLYEPVTLGEFIKDFAFKFGELVNELFDAAIDLDSLYEDLKDIEEEFSIQEGDYESSLEVIAVGATTPEDKYGPAGYDVDATSVEARQRFVTGDQEFYYRVDFWNKEDATAPAYDVLVEDQLDESLDWGSFRFEEVGFLQWNVDLEPCQYFNVDVDTRPDMDWIVNVEGTFDPDTGLATWRFRTLDPITRQTPDDPMAGFLPPITESGEEIGWVDFTVRPKDGLATGTQIANQAFVEFDHAGDLYNHPAPKEGPWVNTIDAGKPTSSVQALPGEMASGTIVSWAGQDDENGSGIATYTIYVSDDEGPWEIWLAGTAETSAAFTGEVGHSYGFRSVARDNVGHVEDDPGVVEASTVIVAAEGPPLYGVCYGPFREGQSPELGIFPTEEQVEQDISIIAGMASAARTYGIDNVLGEIPRICDQYGVGCYAGGWISGDPTWDQQTVSDLIALASEGYDTTQALIVGSESLLFNHVTEQELIDLIGQVDAATEVPVTTGEPWSIWVDHPNLANAVDFIGIHVHPYWEDIPIDDAAQYVIDKYNAVQQAYPDKEVVILETGWPSAGDVHGPAVPSDANQAQFLVDFVPLAEAQNVKYFIFEAFDEPWKQKYGEVEGHWGLHYEDRTPKPALDGILAPMRVDSVGVRPCGFVVHFTSGPDSAVLNLYDTGASAYGPADMTVVGDTVGPVAGSLVYNEETSTVTFVKTGGPLLADTYTVTLVSRPDGFKDVSGRLLDGDADGVEGGDYVTTVTVESSTGRIVSVPDVTRGPGQDVNIPAADSGIPITIDDGINVEAVSFVFEYDPTLLTVTGASAAPGLAGNWVVDYDLIMPGRVSVTAGGSVALAAGENELVRLQAAIPADAPYKSTAILRLEDLNINGAVIEVAPDCGLQVVAYIGDASGNRAYSDYDADLILRVSVASDSGFAAYPMMDPVLIGDVTG